MTELVTMLRVTLCMEMLQYKTFAPVNKIGLFIKYFIISKYYILFLCAL
jgi:hypothetical protein